MNTKYLELHRLRKFPNLSAVSKYLRWDLAEAKRYMQLPRGEDIPVMTNGRELESDDEGLNLGIGLCEMGAGSIGIFASYRFGASEDREHIRNKLEVHGRFLGGPSKLRIGIYDPKDDVVKAFQVPFLDALAEAMGIPA